LFPFASLMLLICVFFLLLWDVLAKGLSILIIFVKNQFFVLLILYKVFGLCFINFCSNFHHFFPSINLGLVFLLVFVQSWGAALGYFFFCFSF
jgi:hypothetical protein